MLRKPSRAHPLRTARGILGFSQTQFAASVGTSAVNIQQIENGVSKMSPGLARQISKVHGLDPRQLMSGDDPDHPRLVFSNLPFTKEYSERFRTVSPGELQYQRAKLSFTLDLLFDVADDKRLYHAFLYDLLDRLKKQIGELDLVEPAIQKLAAYSGYPEGSEVTRQIFEMLFNAASLEIKTLVETRNKLRKKPKPRLVEPQSSAADKAPKKIAPQVPQRGLDSGAEKPSSSRRGRAAD